MKRETLKELGVPEEALDGVMAEYGKSVTAKNSEIDSLKAERDSQKEQLDQRNKDIEALRKDSGTSQEVKDELESWKSKYSELEETSQTELNEMKLQSALDLALATADVHNPRAVKGLLNMEDVKVTDDGVKGLKEQLEALKESDAYLFKQEVEKDEVKPPFFIPEGNNNNGGGIQLTKETFSNMSYGERKELKDKQPEVYKQLTKQESVKTWRQLYQQICLIQKYQEI